MKGRSGFKFRLPAFAACLSVAMATAPRLPASYAQGPAGPGDEGLKDFSSSRHHFTVRYPAAWYQAEGLADILDITNFRRHRSEEGIALKVGGAEITVTAARTDIRTADDWINRDVPDDPSVMGGGQIEHTDVVIAKPAADGCQAIRQVSWREEIAPNAYFARSMYYCSAGARLFRIALTDWDGDPAQSRLRDVAVKIALSLRTQ